MLPDHLRWTGRADLHMHTTASDGTADVQTLLAFIADQRRDLDVIAITDHDRLDSSLWAYENRQQYPFDVVPGLEVTTQAGHILALWVTTPILRGCPCWKQSRRSTWRVAWRSSPILTNRLSTSHLFGATFGILMC